MTLAIYQGLRLELEEGRPQDIHESMSCTTSTLTGVAADKVLAVSCQVPPVSGPIKPLGRISVKVEFPEL